MVSSSSIVIPAHNEQDFLHGLLSSLEKHLSVKPQVIVVANGCTDNTVDVARQFACEIVEIEQKQNPSTARNSGVKKATGDVLVFLDADVEITESWAQAFTELLESCNPEELFITGDQYHISKQPSWIEHSWFEPLRALPKSYINGGNIIVSASAYKALNGFDEELETGEDVDFCLRAKRQGANYSVDPRLVTLHEGFPKDTKNFLRRERWHGKGDYKDLSTFLRSKTALVTAAFFVLHLLLFGSLLAFFIGIGGENTQRVFIVSLLSVFCLIVLTTVMRFKSLTIISKPLVMVIQYLYFIGRMRSMIDALGARIGKKSVYK